MEAIGLVLRLTTTEEGGRSTPLRGAGPDDPPFGYRPDWDLPGFDGLAGAPVWRLSADVAEPGDTVRAVVVPLVPHPEWAALAIGDELPMHEGARVCGVGRVAWRGDLDDAARWLAEPRP